MADKLATRGAKGYKHHSFEHVQTWGEIEYLSLWFDGSGGKTVTKQQAGATRSP